MEPEVLFGTRCQGYPKYSRKDGGLTVTDRFYVQTTEFSSDLLESAENNTLTDGDAELAVTDVSAEPNESGAMMFINVVYSRASGGGSGSTARDGAVEFTFEDSGQEIPIDKKKNDLTPWFSKYRTKHNFHLVGAKDKTYSTFQTDIGPDHWNTATDLEFAGAAAEKKKLYRWIREMADLPGEDWTLLKNKTKNIEAVASPSPVVVETRKYKSYNTAVGKRKKYGTIQTPERTFGETGQWLVVSSIVYPDGRRWVVQTRYQLAPEWDSDYYETV